MTDICWICQTKKADSGEHGIKRSDLVGYGRPTQAKPWHHYDMEKRRNTRIGGLDGNILKLPVKICTHCNNTRTQEYDRAWEFMSATLRDEPDLLTPGRFLRCDRIFRDDTRRAMANVQLFFLKIFGCHLVHAVKNFDAKPFSRCLMERRPHPEVYLSIGTSPKWTEILIAGSSTLLVLEDDQRGHVGGAAWLYTIGNATVQVTYATDPIEFHKAKESWNPQFNPKGFTVWKFDDHKVNRADLKHVQA